MHIVILFREDGLETGFSLKPWSPLPSHHPMIVQGVEGGESPHCESSGVPPSVEPREVHGYKTMNFSPVPRSYYFSTFIIGLELLGAQEGKIVAQ